VKGVESVPQCGIPCQQRAFLDLGQSEGKQVVAPRLGVGLAQRLHAPNTFGQKLADLQSHVQQVRVLLL